VRLLHLVNKNIDRPKRPGIQQVIWKFMDTEPAVAFALATRSWQAIAGVVSLLLIVNYFEPQLQGFYYTFGSLLALQSFIELGLFLVVVNVASHEWAHLELDRYGRIRGDANAVSRLISLGRFIFKWYAAASAIFVAVVGTGGFAFFSQRVYPGVEWHIPWFLVVMISGLVLWTQPFMSLLEGCNQVNILNRYKLVQALLANAGLWLIILLGGGLWAIVVSAAVNLACSLYVLLVRYGSFFHPFYSSPLGPRLRWKSDIWPMQWRLAIQGIVYYFMNSLFNPIMFQYHGATVAGQMGVTLQLANMLQMFAAAWAQTRAPLFGILVARRDYATVDRLWWRTLIVSGIFVGISATALWLLIYTFNVLEQPLAERLLGPLPIGLFFTGAVLMVVIQCQAVYLRAYRKEPLLVSGLLSGIVAGVLIWWLGSQYGPTGAASAYLAVVSLVSLPLVTYIWYRSRAKWQAE
jgi:O-antigen/teichoic acid export membrane protein